VNKITVAMVWQQGPGEGTIEASNGPVVSLRLTAGKGRARGTGFVADSATPCRIELTIANANIAPGAGATRVTVRAAAHAFTFFLRDVRPERPIWIPVYGVAVTAVADSRTYAEIAAAVQAQHLSTTLERCDQEPEESYEEAARHTRQVEVPTWLGLSRDMRIFEFAFRRAGFSMFDQIVPRFHGYGVPLPEAENKDVRYQFVIGRGWGCINDIRRRLEDGALPILHATLNDEDVQYEVTAFVGLEKGPLTAANLRGTDYLVADGYGHGNMLTPAQKTQREALLPAELSQPEETVFCCRVTAVNTAKVPRYAWFMGLQPVAPGGLTKPFEWELDAHGFGVYKASGRVFAVTRLNGQPMPQNEVGVLVEPGATAVYEFYLPHRPIPAARAQALAKADFAERHAECSAFWQAKLASAAQISLPEPRVDEMTKAGLLHLDLVTYGKEPDGAMAATIGVYCPIGSESSPIIQFFDSMGWHDVARRSLSYFLEKQHDDGFIQNFGGYMLETGPALWSMGEHYRLTRDNAWVRSIAPKLIKSCDFMLEWRNRNKTEALRGKGYGLQEGKVADPVDPFHSFMLNGYAYLGMSRVAEMLGKVNPRQSRRLAKEAEAFKTDIRAAFFQTMAQSPVVPLGDGSWCPTCAPWTEDQGPLCLYAKPGRWYTHGTFTGRDSLLGPIYLIFTEVLDPHEPASDWLLDWHAELLCQRNVALSQPYYSRHPQVHLLRGEVKPFLKTFYNGFAGLADRETYSWWEHYFHASPHKTHEEGWHLMQTRWMLYKESGDTLTFLPAVPRRWLESGKRIALSRVATYFGPASLEVVSDLDHGIVEARIECRSNRRPKVVEVRLPHPRGTQARTVSGGEYIPERETVRIPHFKGAATVTLTF